MSHLLYERFAADRQNELIAAADRERLARTARRRMLHPRLGRGLVDAGLRLVRMGVRLAHGPEASFVLGDFARSSNPVVVAGGTSGHVTGDS